MEKRRTAKLKTQNKKPRVLTEEEQVIKSLLASGAIEITPEEMQKEPYKTYMKNIKKDGKFICD